MMTRTMSLLASAAFAVATLSAPVSAAPLAAHSIDGGNASLLTEIGYKHRKGHKYRNDYRGRYWSHDDAYVDAPYTRVDRYRSRVDVDAPYASVRRSRHGVRVRAPFVDIYIPR